MIFFLTLEQVVVLHDDQLAMHGGLPGFRDRSAIEGMIARVENLRGDEGEKDLFTLAAAYLLAIARGHGFNDANKRTALASALVFLEMNGISVFPPVEYADYVVEAAQGLHDIHHVSESLRKLGNAHD
ncbi:type II toxin-antitoxin system death-on-curing family toxin [Brenneria populi subsp. brevivirga]|uniref:type II toxin-antitoxin system death-on-curing family toxin n=1 Tax=Brenneria populi TaxID=1505588 RepID=UPI002E180151|nr:type II toxin-antitoxin system death-on-curing family toxin [Brenneria populi subsp. brevivirga]